MYAFAATAYSVTVLQSSPAPSIHGAASATTYKTQHLRPSGHISEPNARIGFEFLDSATFANLLAKPAMVVRPGPPMIAVFTYLLTHGRILLFGRTAALG